MDDPVRVELGVGVVLEEILAHEAVTRREAHQAALTAHEAPIDIAKLLNKRTNTHPVESQRFHLGNDLFLQPVALTHFRGTERLTTQPVSEVPLLQSAGRLYLSAILSNVASTRRHEFGLDSREGHRVLTVLVRRSCRPASDYKFKPRALAESQTGGDTGRGAIDLGA